VRADAELGGLATMLAGGEASAVVVDAAGNAIGLVDKDALLRNVQAVRR
jgi:hypothetical protein